MPICIMLGANSDIARELTPRLMADGWTVLPWARGDDLPRTEWDAVICAIGTLTPIGNFFDTDVQEWSDGISANAMTPLQLLRGLWPRLSLIHI